MLLKTFLLEGAIIAAAIATAVAAITGMKIFLDHDRGRNRL